MTILDRLAIYLVLAGIVVLAAGAAYGRWEYIVRQNTALKEQKAQAVEVAAQNQQAFDQLNGRFDALDKTLKDREVREQKLQASINGVRRDLNDLKKQDPVVQKWSDDAVPPAISERLRADPAADKSAGGEGKGEAAGQSPKPLPGAAVVGAIKRGLVRLHPRAPAPAKRVQ